MRRVKIQEQKGPSQESFTLCEFPGSKSTGSQNRGKSARANPTTGAVRCDRRDAIELVKDLNKFKKESKDR